MILLINNLFSHCDLCLFVMNFSHLKDGVVRNMRSLDWLKFVLVLTSSASSAFGAFGQPSVIITLMSPSFKVRFPPVCNRPPRALHLDSQNERREVDKTETGGAAAGPSCCQGLAPGSWGSSRHLVHTGPEQLVQLLTGRA